MYGLKTIYRCLPRRVLPYALAIVSVTGALFLELAFTYSHLPHAFAALALSAIAITFWYGSAKPGIVAVLMSILIRSCLFEAEIPTVSRVLYDLIFVIFAVLMSWLKVAERTTERTQANEELKNEATSANCKILLSVRSSSAAAALFRSMTIG